MKRRGFNYNIQVAGWFIIEEAKTVPHLVLEHILRIGCARAAATDPH
jgi:hypothetical protein